MSSSKYLVAMLRSRAEGDDEQFYSIALQVAAAEARQGHRTTANEIRAAVDEARSTNGVSPSVVVPFALPRGDLAGLLDLRKSRATLGNVVVSPGLADRLESLLQQQRRRDWLREHGKTPNRRVLLIGPPGVGKTLTAEALAGELRLPLYTIRLEALITRYMGETAAKLRLVFNETLKRRGVYFFDEFDAVGHERAARNDVAEMRRVLSSFLLFLEEPSSVDSLIVAATNHGDMLDRALTRRFDEVLEFALPTDEEVRAIVKSYLRPMLYPRMAWKSILEAARGLSQAEVARASEEAVKAAILSESREIKCQALVDRMKERRAMVAAVKGTPSAAKDVP